MIKILDYKQQKALLRDIFNQCVKRSDIWQVGKYMVTVQTKEDYLDNLERDHLKRQLAEKKALKKRLQTKERRLNRQKNGLCYRCGKKLRSTKFTICKACRDKHNKSRRKGTNQKK